MFFTDDDLIAIFQNQGYRPELLQTVNVERKFIRLQPDLSFDLDDERWIRDLDADPHEYGLGPNLAFTGALYYWLWTGTRDAKKLSILQKRCVSEFQGEDNMDGDQFNYNSHLQALRKETAEMSPARRALWHGKLLYIGIVFATFMLDSDLEIMEKGLVDFISEHDVAVQSPLVLHRLFYHFNEAYILIRADAKAQSKFSALVHTHIGLLPVIANLGDFVYRWRHTLRILQIRNATANTPTKEVNPIQLLQWWGDYEHLYDVTLQSFKISPPILFKPHSCASTSVKQIKDITTLLSILSDLLISTTGLMHCTKDGIEFSANNTPSSIFCKAIARTIAVTMNVEERLVFPFSKSAIVAFYNSTRQSNTMQMCVAFELQTVNFLTEIPLSLVFDNPDA